MKSKKMLSYVLVSFLALSSFGAAVYAASVNNMSIAIWQPDTEYMSVREMNFDGSDVFPVYVDNSTTDNPKDTWVEIRNSGGDTLLVVDMAQTFIDEDTSLLMFSKDYYENEIKPIIESNK